MHRIDNATAASALPTPQPQGPDGYFTGGNPTLGQTATIVEADWLNNVQEELVNVILRGGLTLDKTSNTQLLHALSNLFTGAYIQISVTQSLLVPPWATQVAFRLIGAGGGGAHCQSNGTTYTSGAGGASGAYAEAQRPATPGQLLTAIVGVGGSSEAVGGDTSLSFPGQWSVTAGGGHPGTWSAPGNSPGGYGGVASGGDLNSNGTFGGDGQANSITSYTGYGGPGPWGGGARAANRDPNPGKGTGPGAGGAGVYDNTNSGIYVSGGVGANGLIQYRFLP